LNLDIFELYHKKKLLQILALGNMREVHENIMTYSYTISQADARPERTYGAVQNHYYTPQQQQPPQPAKTYHWKMGEWSVCDQLCNGDQVRSATCVQSDTGDNVSPSLCRTTIQPNTEYGRCNDFCSLE
jgi:hypothetical protein